MTAPTACFAPEADGFRVCLANIKVILNLWKNFSNFFSENFRKFASLIIDAYKYDVPLFQ